jgi:hypothetical protein
MKKNCLPTDHHIRDAGRVKGTSKLSEKGLIHWHSALQQDGYQLADQA